MLAHGSSDSVPVPLAVRQLLEYAGQNIPYYRSKASVFYDLPIIDKRIVLGNIESFISDRIRDKKGALLKCLTAESAERRREFKFDNEIVIEETSGSSGVPFRIPKAVCERSVAAFNIWKFRRALDPLVTPKNFYLAIHAPGGIPRRRHPSPDCLWQFLEDRDFRWVHLNPPILANCVKAARPEAARSGCVRFAETSGQPLPPALRRSAEEKLGIKVVDQYGCREMWVIGYGTNDDGFEILSENVFVELVDSAGCRIDTIGEIGRVVVTSLTQRLLPFIRYDTGDLGQWCAGKSGGNLLRLAPYRSHNFILGSARGICGSIVFKNMMVGALHKMGHINLQYLQIRQLSEDRFAIATDRHPRAEELRSTLEGMFNAGKFFDHPVRFDHVVHEVDAVDGEKEDLFTNRHFLPGPTVNRQMRS